MNTLSIAALVLIAIGLLLGSLHWRGFISNEILAKLDQIASILSLALGLIVLAVSARTDSSPTASAFILGEADAGDTYQISGDEIAKYNIGDELVVYGMLMQDVEVPIALLRVTGKDPDTLYAQAILSHPELPIQPNLLVDNRIDRLRTSELVPSSPIAVGYLKEEGIVRMLPGSVLDYNTQFQALKPEVIGNRIVDHLPFEPPIRMRVTRVGVESVIAQVELISGEWPEPGTLVSVFPYRLDFIEVSDEKGTQGEIEETVLHANNCKGDESMEMVLPAEKGYTHELLIEPRPRAVIDLEQTRAEIYEYYRVWNPLDQVKSVCSIPASAPAHTYYVYEVEWTETWREGSVEIDVPDNSPEATYRIRETILCEVVGVSFGMVQKTAKLD